MPDTEQGKHFDQGKPPLALLSRLALEDTAHVLAFGAEKYEPHNWRKGISWTSIMNSALRHLMAFNDGEDLDPESGLSHLAHAMCDVMFLLEYTHEEETPNDDRWIRVQSELTKATVSNVPVERKPFIG